MAQRSQCSRLGKARPGSHSDEVIPPGLSLADLGLSRPFMEVWDAAQARPWRGNSSVEEVAADQGVDASLLQSYWDAVDVMNDLRRQVEQQQLVYLSARTILTDEEKLDLWSLTTTSPEIAEVGDNILKEASGREAQVSLRVAQILAWMESEYVKTRVFAHFGEVIDVPYRAPRPLRSPLDSVYYVQRTDGLIKIGYTSQLRNRMSALRAEFGPLTQLAVHAGGYKAEQSMHRKFAAHRVRGEWFRPSADLLAHIARIIESQQSRTTPVVESA